ncbi:YqhA family protein [Microbulbifer donghaiensis]|uniref:YqhA family protein n=1 Tax=Microbulbifer donghaiensis TaxID=494016 RepID=UPI0009340E69|nr:YqhA family protein [Microbulbifer donghaiensis]
MKALIEATRHIMTGATLALLIVAFFAMLWGGAKAVQAIALIVSSRGESHDIEVYLIRVVDAFLISIVLYLFAVSIYQLFIGGLALPVAKDLGEMKGQLSGVIIMVLAIQFVEDVMGEAPPQQLLYEGVSIAVVASVLLVLSYIARRKR